MGSTSTFISDETRFAGQSYEEEEASQAGLFFIRHKAVKRLAKENTPLNHSPYNVITEEGKLNFDAWHDTKLETYWYDETVKVLNEIAPFIRGFAEFDFEREYKFRIKFEDGEVFIQRQPEVDWRTIDSEPLREVQ